jgi:hypothetical protein
MMTVNRVVQWRQVEIAKGRQVGGSMREHYTEHVQLLDARLRILEGSLVGYIGA